jgi:predicted phage-related endonuclease
MSNKTVGQKTAEAIAELGQVRAAIKALEAQERALRDNIVDALGDHKVAVFRNQTIARLAFVSRTTIDSKALAEKFPEAFDATKRESTSARLTLA